jgi:hypothetical protein
MQNTTLFLILISRDFEYIQSCFKIILELLVEIKKTLFLPVFPQPPKLVKSVKKNNGIGSVVFDLFSARK